MFITVPGKDSGNDRNDHSGGFLDRKYRFAFYFWSDSHFAVEIAENWTYEGRVPTTVGRALGKQTRHNPNVYFPPVLYQLAR